MNVENINKVIESIKTDAKAFKMYNFVQTTNDGTPKDEYGGPLKWDCGTAMCIAGWANLIRLEEAGEMPKKVESLKGAYRNIFAQQFSSEDAAGRWLGLDWETARSLFYMSYVTYDGVAERESFDELPDEIRSKAGILALEHLRDTGRVDWEGAIKAAQLQA